MAALGLVDNTAHGERRSGDGALDDVLRRAPYRPSRGGCGASNLAEVDLKVAGHHRAGVRAEKSVFQASQCIATCITLVRPETNWRSYRNDVQAIEPDDRSVYSDCSAHTLQCGSAQARNAIRSCA